MRLNLDTVNGSISIPPTTGNVKSETVNGSIKMNGTRGTVNAQTVNGKTLNGGIDIKQL